MVGIVGGLAATGAIDLSGFVSEEINGGGSPAVYTMEADGVLTTTTSSGYWVRNTAPTNYEVYATVTVGSLTSGTTGSWLDFSTDRTWQKSAGTCTVQLELRDKYTTSVVKTVSIVLTA